MISFLSLLKKINTKHIADLGCGTGRLTVHVAQEGYQITAIDPNQEAINHAKRKKIADKVSWMVGDSSDLLSDAYDVVIMTANVAQVFLTDESWQQVIADAYRALKDGGHFIFDTRNPLAKEWETWMQDKTPDFAKHPISGEQLEIITDYEGLDDGIFTFYETVKISSTKEILVCEKMQLKFRAMEEIQHTLEQAGFSKVKVYGDWEFEQADAQSKSFIFHSMK
ncbi:class I SAM-dependent methyltransferase [Virgibacillus halophilus]|uniref:Class I SAM-dependent methyltransferase n=1 Tax=Tigheibacillus halophilus TaxID=361280 RepID=A0ABU5C8K2_9BACI|nr:class I SAM-dependent methyltransferase [Virgibacillus halophilus]